MFQFFLQMKLYCSNNCIPKPYNSFFSSNYYGLVFVIFQSKSCLSEEIKSDTNCTQTLCNLTVHPIRHLHDVGCLPNEMGGTPYWVSLRNLSWAFASMSHLNIWCISPPIEMRMGRSNGQSSTCSIQNFELKKKKKRTFHF